MVSFLFSLSLCPRVCVCSVCPVGHFFTDYRLHSSDEISSVEFGRYAPTSADRPAATGPPGSVSHKHTHLPTGLCHVPASQCATVCLGIALVFRSIECLSGRNRSHCCSHCTLCTFTLRTVHHFLASGGASIGAACSNCAHCKCALSPVGNVDMSRCRHCSPLCTPPTCAIQ